MSLINATMASPRAMSSPEIRSEWFLNVSEIVSAKDITVSSTAKRDEAAVRDFLTFLK